MKKKTSSDHSSLDSLGFFLEILSFVQITLETDVRWIKRAHIRLSVSTMKTEGAANYQGKTEQTLRLSLRYHLSVGFPEVPSLLTKDFSAWVFWSDEDSAGGTLACFR